MANRFYDAKNEWGKSLVPVDTPKTKTSAKSDEFVHLSWLDTTDEFQTAPTKTVLATNKAVAEAVKSVQGDIDGKQDKFTINDNEVDASVVFATGEGASVTVELVSESVHVTFTLNQATDTAIGGVKLYDTEVSEKTDGTYTAKHIDKIIEKKCEIATEDYTIENGEVLIPMDKASHLLSFVIDNEFVYPTVTISDENYVATFFEAEDEHYNDSTNVTVTYFA